jgi:hypothetical protein
MMKLFRKHTKIVVWIIVISFAIWGGYSATTLKKEGRYAGEVFGKGVSFQDYNRFYNATQLFMPTKDKSELENAEVLRTFTWQNIIYAREAKNLGIKVSDADVRQEITNILTQQGIQSPTQEQYRIWVTRTLRIAPREFEECLREFMRIQRLLRMKFQSFDAANASKIPAGTDPSKAEEEAKQKSQQAFMAWTNELNQRAALKDYLTPSPEAAGQTVEETVPQPPAPKTEKLILKKTPTAKKKSQA